MTRGPQDTGASRELTAEESERLSRYLAEELPAEERSRIEKEILAEPRLSEALYADLNLRESIASVDDVTRARARREGTGAQSERRWLRLAVPAAALVVLAALIPRFFEPDEGETRRLRSPTPQERPAAPSKHPSAPSKAPAVAALFPTGSFDEAPKHFLWTRDPAATSYRLEISDESSRILFSTETPETTLAFPGAELRGGAGKILSWRVLPIHGTAPGQPSTPLRFQFGP